MGTRKVGGSLAVVLGIALALSLPAASAAAPGNPDSWRDGSPLALGRFFPAMTILSDSRVLIAGGGTTGPGATNTAEIYNPTTGAWSAAANLNDAYVTAGAVRLASGRVLVFGSTSGSDVSAEVFDPAANTWTNTATPMRDARSGSTFTGPPAFAATALSNGKALLAGSSAAPTVHADLYDPADNSFHNAADMGTARQLPGQAPLPGGKVLVAGGFDGTNALTTGEVYDPGTDTWTPVTNQLSAGHVAPVLVPLPGGKVLIFGGVATFPQPIPAVGADVYDPTTNTFSPTAGPSTPRLVPNVTPLADGRVLISAGITPNTGTPTFLTSTEIYSPKTGTWTTVSPVPAPLTGGGAALLPDGDVLVAGGVVDSSVSAPPTRTELYTPATVPTAPLAVVATAGNGTAAVTWAPPQVEGGSRITGYTVTASSGQRVTTPDARTNTTITGLRNGTKVTFTVTAINSFGTGPTSAPSAAVTPTAPDTTPPRLTISKLAGTLKLKAFLKGVSATITPNEPSSLDVALLASARAATISRAFNLTLASKTFGRGGTRKVTLKPNRRLIGHARKFSVILRVIATDRAGNRRAVTKTIQIKP